MKLVTIKTYNQPFELQVDRAKLDAENIDYFIKDEYIVTTNQFLANAVGGIKLQVKEEDIEKALFALKQEGEILFDDIPEMVQEDIEPIQVCPKCGSQDVFFEKYTGWMWALAILLLGVPFVFQTKKWKCEDCAHTWK